MKVGKSFAICKMMEALSRPSNILIQAAQTKLILCALKLGHNVQLYQLPFTPANFSSVNFIPPVQGTEQLDMFPLDRNIF